MKRVIKDRYLSIRIPISVEEELRKRADKETRTLASQVLHYIKLGLASNGKNNAQS